MPRPKLLTFDLTDVAATGLAQAQTPAGAGAFTLNGALISGGVFTADMARQLLCTTVANESAKTFIFTGTDADGKALTESMTGPNATTAETGSYFKTITSITTSAGTTGNVSFGTVDEGMSQTIPLNFGSDTAATVFVDVVGTINFTLLETFGDVLTTAAPIQTNTWPAITAFSAKTADTAGSATLHARALLLLVNSYTNGAEIRVTVLQSDA
jgi:hypothetical protein